MNIPKAKKLPSGSYRIQIQVDGHRYSITDKDPKVVKQKAKEVYAGLQVEKRIPMTVGKAFDRYIELKEAVLSPATILGYKRIRKNLLQRLMEINISSLTQEQIQKAVNEEYKSGKSPKTIRNAHGLLSAVLREYRPGFVLRTTLPQKNPYEIHILTEEELVRVIKAASPKYQQAILLASWLGLRMSEILGLHYEDISNGRIHIQRAIVTGEAGPTEKGTKSFAGDRWIRCPQIILDGLGESHGQIFAGYTGAMIYKGFITACHKANITPCRFHDLRHFAASEAHSLGVPDKYQMKRMGHKTDNMLKTVYQHTMRDKEDAFADLIDERMEKLLSAHNNAHEKI